MEDTVFAETDESPIHPQLDPEPEVKESGWVSRETYLASVRQLTGVNRTIADHLRTVVVWLAVSVAGNIVLAFLMVSK